MNNLWRKTYSTRASAVYRLFCNAPEELIGPDCEPEIIERFKFALPIPCEGGGIPGPWCHHCHFGDEEDLEDDT